MQFVTNDVGQEFPFCYYWFYLGVSADCQLRVSGRMHGLCTRARTDQEGEMHVLCTCARIDEERERKKGGGGGG